MSRTPKAFENNKFSIGDRNGRLVIIGDFQYMIFANEKRPACKVRCDCGTEKFIRLKCFKSTISCGCIVSLKHGEARYRQNSVLYNRWILMKQRCSNSSCDFYHRYGGRGIAVCEEWQKDYASFRDWALRNGFKPELQLDRIDNNGHYCPENCRWSTASENMRNTSRSKQYKEE